MAKKRSPSPGRRRSTASGGRRAAAASASEPLAPAQRILEAARDVFLERGFGAARVEDIAGRAGVAKGSVYLHYAGKEALLEALIRSLATGPIAQLEALLADERASSADLLARALQVVRSGVLETERRLVVRLLLTEGHRFPKVAAYYHRHVVGRALAAVRAVVERGVARGEFRRDALAREPRLFAAPLVLAVVWEGLFGAREPLDVRRLLDAHLELLLHGLEARA